nr:DUF3995 domain-containing protein [Mesorhizobium sp. ZC-5]
MALFAIAALHAYWGFGGVWPGTDAASCARTVAGFRGVDTMPGPGASFAVTAALAAAALIVLVQGGWILPPLPGALFTLAAIGAALVFLGRGIAGFTPAWRRLTPEQPFARLDVRYYSPLCLLIGLALLLLALKGFV